MMRRRSAGLLLLAVLLAAALPLGARQHTAVAGPTPPTYGLPALNVLPPVTGAWSEPRPASAPTGGAAQPTIVLPSAATPTTLPRARPATPEHTSHPDAATGVPRGRSPPA